MRKLGKRQLQILQTMSEGHSVFSRMHFNTGWFSGHIGDEINRIINLDRLFALRDKGLIENVTEEGWRWRGSEYKITEKGLALVKENHD